MHFARFALILLLAASSLHQATQANDETSTASSSQSTASFSIVIHGGAGGNPDRWSDEYKQQRISGLSKALDLGVQRLESGGKAIDVVEEVVRLLEDDPTFNAGRGCVLNETGEHELDASIMDGQTLACGAVASVSTIRHPISLAKRVMSETKHVLLMGEGAEKFGALQGLETATADHFRTSERLNQWKAWKQRNTGAELGAILPLPRRLEEPYFGTVGCVVVDQHGNLAAATSTGGLMGKKWGRVGDSPVIGAGNYANNASCAVSGTGVGEEFIRHNIAADVSARMLYGDKNLAEAARESIQSLPENCGGIIAVDKQGNVVMEFNTKAMSRAFATSEGKRGVELAR
ncbi:MAG: isoaspartyl peptidase/L-asparaginase family protein [Aureliella sp.]